MNLALIKDLFNLGKLTLADAQWCAEHGYDVVCGDGEVKSITESGT